VDKRDKDPMSPGYSVGYKKPPVHSQFKPGQSGNPRGRPKKTPTVSQFVQKHLRKTVVVIIGDEPQKLSMMEAIAIRQVSLAAKGDHKSTQFVMDTLAGSDADSQDKLGELLQCFRAIDDSRSAISRKSIPTPKPPRSSEKPGGEDEA
jgi:hypothetical protein